MDLHTKYDAINRALFLPSGGSRRLRRELVDALRVQPGHRVLELGCGTGLVTELLVDAGADVVGVEARADMLVGAQRRAPGALLVEGDAFEVEVGDDYDRVVISFVLHNFDPDGRIRLLRRARSALSPHGRIGVLEWAQPSGSVRAPLWRRFLAVLEPSPSVPEILDGALDTELAVAGLQVDERRRPAGGRTQILVLSPFTP